MEDAKGPRNQGLFYHETVMKSYQAFRKSGVNVDIINMEQCLELYQMIAAPMLYMFRAGIEEKLRRFVQNGGILVMTYWSSIMDETLPIYGNELGMEQSYVYHHLCDLVQLKGAVRSFFLYLHTKIM